MQWTPIRRVPLPALLEKNANKRLSLEEGTTVYGFSILLSDAGDACKTLIGDFSKLEVCWPTGDQTANIRQRR